MTTLPPACGGTRFGRRAGAELAVLPEYLSLELAGSFADSVRTNFIASLDALQDQHAAWQTLFAGLALDCGLHVLAGTFLLRQANGRYRNRAELFAPDGRRWFQDKLTLTGFERAAGVIEPGDSLQVFDTALGRVAVNDLLRQRISAGTPVASTRPVRACCSCRAVRIRPRARRAYVSGCLACARKPDSCRAVGHGRRRGLESGARYQYRHGRGVCSQRSRTARMTAWSRRAEHGAIWTLADIDADALTRVRREGQVANAADWDAQLRPVVTAAVVR